MQDDERKGWREHESVWCIVSLHDGVVFLGTWSGKVHRIHVQEAGLYHGARQVCDCAVLSMAIAEQTLAIGDANGCVHLCSLELVVLERLTTHCHEVWCLEVVSEDGIPGGIYAGSAGGVLFTIDAG